MQTFPGFRAGVSRHTPLPASFFSELLPLIDDLAELQLTLCCCQALALKDAPVRYLRLEELQADENLLAALQRSAPEQDPAEALQGALQRALQRRSLLAVCVGADEPAQQLYVLNSVAGRDLVARVEAGAWRPGDGQDPVELLPERPNLFRLYEANVGTITPMLAEELKEAEASFPNAWLAEAIQLAVENNVRNWRYIRSILERWEKEGKDRAGRTAREDGRRFTSGRYAEFIDS